MNNNVIDNNNVAILYFKYKLKKTKLIILAIVLHVILKFYNSTED